MDMSCHPCSLSALPTDGGWQGTIKKRELHLFGWLTMVPHFRILKWPLPAQRRCAAGTATPFSDFEGESSEPKALFVRPLSIS